MCFAICAFCDFLNRQVNDPFRRYRCFDFIGDYWLNEVHSELDKFGNTPELFLCFCSTNDNHVKRMQHSSKN